MKSIWLLALALTTNVSWATSPVEQGIRLFNQKEYQQAKQIFQQQSEQGNAYATYWLAITQYKNGQHFDAGNTFLKAAQWLTKMVVPYSKCSSLKKNKLS